MRIAIFAMIVLLGFGSQAAQVQDARVDVLRQLIEVDVMYSGGCKPHTFELQMRGCDRARPMSCVAELIDHTVDDTCRGLVMETIELPAPGVLTSDMLGALLVIGTEESAAIAEFIEI